jgi:transposase-like protein/DNA-directed RNA polymerase subunit RPC12/RpoP
MANTKPLEAVAMPEFPRSLLEFQRQFSDEAACAAWLAETRWPDGFRCPVCGHDHGWHLDTKAWTYECARCGRQTSVTAGTVMHGSKLPLTVWFWAAYLMATHSNGISARQLWRQLGLGSYKSAWLLCAKLRRAMVRPARTLLSGLVEIDETQIPYRTKDDPVAGRGGRAPEGKMQVIVAVEVIDDAPGRLRLGVIEDASAASLHPFITDNVAPGSTLKTDGWSGYPGVAGFKHEPHAIGSMAAHVILPWVHRVIANLKTWGLGVYHGLRRKHLQAYLDEFVFRFNRRRTPHAAFRSLLAIGLAIKPVTYNMLIAPEAKG